MFNDLHSPIYFFAVATLILGLILTLFYTRHNFKAGLPQKLLALVFFCMLYLFVVQFLIIFNFISNYPIFFRTGALSTLVYIPLMYFYVVLNLETKKWNWIYLMHFIPAVLYLVNFFPFFIKSFQEKQQIIYQIEQANTLYFYNEGFLVSDKFVHALRILQVLVYIILLLLLTQKNWAQLKRNVFLKRVSLASIAYLSIYFLIAFYWVFEKENSNAVVIALMSNNLLFFLFFFFNPGLLLSSVKYNKENTRESLVHPISNNVVPEFVPAIILPTNNKPTPKTKQGNARNRVRIGKIERYFVENKPYLDQEFSLKIATKQLGMSPKLLSQSIKLKYGLNFNSYVNGLRIDYALQKIHTDKTWRKLNIEQMAASVGYASTNLFYRYFTKKTGSTPREFIENLDDDMLFTED